MSAEDKEIKWDKSAKGRGNKWRMLRDLVAILSLNAMSLMMIQDTMLRLRGLSRGKVMEMMNQLQRAGDIKETVGTVGGVTVHGWTTTDQGVALWLRGTRMDIPARIVQAASTMRYAVKSEESRPDEV
jgi:hypothetical protein